MIATLADAGLLDYPLSIAHRDRPDFLLDSGGTAIGLEVTEATSEQFAAYDAVAEREFPDALLEPAHFRWGAPRMTVEEMRVLLRQSQLSSDGWAGDRPEQEWALFIQSAVDTKLAKLARSDFAKFDRNWLSVYDNLPLPNIDLAKAIRYLNPLLEDRWRRNPAFDTLFVEHGPIVVQVTATTSNQLLLSDLWQ